MAFSFYEHDRGMKQEGIMAIRAKITGCALIVLTMSIAGAAWSANIYVSPAGGGDGTSAGNPTDLQTALNTAAGNGNEADTIYLQQGTYVENFSYLPGAGNNGDLAILGGWSSDFSTRITDPANTILDGSNAGRVLTLNIDPTDFTCPTSGNIKVEGITVRNGRARIGAGILAYTLTPGSVELDHNIMENNTAPGTDGGVGGGCTLGCLNMADAAGVDIRLTNTIIRHNSAQGDAVENGEGGGCVILSSGTTWIVNNLIHNNSAGTNNTAYGLGGGFVLNMYAGDAYVINNSITENIVHARPGSTDGSGGGILVETDEEDAWAVSNVYLYNNIIYHNTCVSPFGSGDIANNITDSDPYANTLVMSHNDYGSYGTNTGAVAPQLIDNIRSDPVFSRSEESLYYLTSRSPCVDAGDNAAPYLPPFDLAGQNRIQDGDNNGTAVVNMGCYEEVIPGGQIYWPMFLPAIISSSTPVPPPPPPPSQPGTVTSAGQIWMDRNLGASRVATSLKDSEAYGDLYQWGRLTDGHEHRSSLTISSQSSSDVPGHDRFITEFSDWRNPANNNLWQGESGINNPCPAGFRLPTEAEWEIERASWTGNNSAGAFASPLKLVQAGTRDSYDGGLDGAGSIGLYWSSTVSGSNSRYLLFGSSGANMDNLNRARGLSVRCLKD